MTGVKRNRTLERFSWYESRPSPIPSTTRQAEALRLTVSRRAGTEEALPEGIDIDTGEPVFTDMVDGVVWVPAHCGTGSAPARAGQSVQIDKVHGDKGGVA